MKQPAVRSEKKLITAINKTPVMQYVPRNAKQFHITSGHCDCYGPITYSNYETESW
jgi:hypothetical protein